MALSTESLAFRIVVFIIVVLALIYLVFAAFYFWRARRGKLGQTAATVMFWLSFIFALLFFILAAWALIRLLYTEKQREEKIKLIKASAAAQASKVGTYFASENVALVSAQPRPSTTTNINVNAPAAPKPPSGPVNVIHGSPAATQLEAVNPVVAAPQYAPPPPPRVVGQDTIFYDRGPCPAGYNTQYVAAMPDEGLPEGYTCRRPQYGASVL